MNSDRVPFRNKVFIRFLLSFAIAFLIPMTTLGFVTYRYFLRLFEQEVTSKNVVSLESAKGILEYQFDQAINMPLLLQSNRVFTTRQPANEYLYFVDATAQLSALRGINSVVYDILFYRPGNDYLIAANYGRSNLAVFLDYLCVYEDWPRDDFLSALNNPGTGLWRGSETVVADRSRREIITYGTYNVASGATFFIQIDSDRFGALLDRSDAGDGGRTTVLDARGRTIYPSVDDVVSLDGSAIDAVMAGTAASAYLPGLGTQGDHLYYSRSELTGFTYVREIPRDYAYARVQLVRNILLATLAVLVALSLVVVYGLARSNYRPIQQLGSIARSLIAEAPSPRDDIASARLAIESLSEMNTEILRSSRIPIKEYAVLKLLKGAYGSLEEFNREAAKIDLRLEGERFRVALLHARHGDWRADQLGSAQDSIELMFCTPGDLRAYSIGGVAPTDIIVVLAFDGDARHDGRLRKFVDAVRILPVPFTVGIGSEVRDPLSVVDSYGKAKLASQQASLEGVSLCVFYDDMEGVENAVLRSPRAELDSLAQTIKAGNVVKLDFILADLGRWMGASDQGFFLNACTGFDIINTMLRAADEAGWDAGAALSRGNLSFDLSSITGIDEMIACVAAIGGGIVELIQARGADIPTGLAATVKAFVAERISDPTLSVQSIADALGMSVSNLSHQFRDESHENLSQLITRMRMAKAKDLLRETDKTLEEIGAPLGYSHVASFVRRFKQVEGITPGEYRKRFS